MYTPRPRRARIEASAIDFVVPLTFLGLFAWWSLQLAGPLAPILIWAILLAVALYPARGWLARRLGIRQGLAAAIVPLVALAIVLGPVRVLAGVIGGTLSHGLVGLFLGPVVLSVFCHLVMTWTIHAANDSQTAADVKEQP